MFSHLYVPVGTDRRTMRAACNQNMKILYLKPTKGCMATSYRGPPSWNKLGSEDKTIGTYETFKRKLLKRMLPAFDNHSL